VFRFNKFEPTDASFQSHYDVPFCDSIRRVKSEYTMITYLSEGHGRLSENGEQESVLTVGCESDPNGSHHKFNRINQPLQGVIFHQSLPHKGRRFINGAKLFLTTELLHYVKDDDEQEFVPEGSHVPHCVLQLNAVPTELKSFATELFNHSSADFRRIYNTRGTNTFCGP